MENLINKTNNIERILGWVERYYRLDGNLYYIDYSKLYINDHEATKEEIEEFLKLKEAFDK